MSDLASAHRRSGGNLSRSPRHVRGSRVLRRVAAGACAALASLPIGAAAQQEVFVDGLVQFAAAVAGTFGDEGGQVKAALDRMSAGLDGWDRAIRAAEAEAAIELAGAPAGVAAHVHLTLATLYAERGRFADALRELETGTGIAPREPRLHRLRGAVLEAMGRPADAAQAFRAAWTLEPTDPIAAYLALRGDAAARDRSPALETLSDAYRRLLQDRPPDGLPAPFVRLSLIPDDALDAPVLPYAAYAEGYALLTRGAYAEAIARLRQAAAGDPLLSDSGAASTSLREGIALLRRGRLADARARLDEAITLAPASSEAHRVQALVYWAGGQHGRSVAHLERAIELDPHDERSRLTLARVFVDAGRHEDAERALLAARAAHPTSGLAHWWLGWHYEGLDRISEARRSFAQAAASNVLAGRARIYVSIARLARREADFTPALDALEHRMHANPNDAVAHLQLARAYHVQGRVGEALAGLIVAALLDPADAEAHMAIGQILMETGRYDEAASALRHALAIEPDLHEARYALATTLRRLGHAGAAAQELDTFARAQRRLLADRRQDIVVQVLKEQAAILTAEGGHDRAAGLWQQVVDHEPDQAASHAGLAAALARAGRTDAAIRHYERAAALWGDPDVFRHLATLYADAGRLDDSARARTRYEQALRGGPGIPDPGR
jgi:tetratricopeptide (TPR) repeat protein